MSRLIIKTAMKTYQLDKHDLTHDFHNKSCREIATMMQSKLEDDAMKEFEQQQDEMFNFGKF